MSSESSKDEETGTVVERRPGITFFVNNIEVTTHERRLTGLKIKALAGLPADYELFLVRGAESIPVANDEVVEIHEHAHFRAIPIGNFG